MTIHIFVYWNSYIETVVLCGFVTLNYLCSLLGLLLFTLANPSDHKRNEKEKKWIACSIYPIFTVQLCAEREQAQKRVAHANLINCTE